MAAIAWAVLLSCGIASCGGASIGRTAAPGEADTGLAVYYSDGLQGRPTASGEPYDKDALTAAHKSLAFGTRVKVTNLSNRRSVTVRVNDRGPFGDSRRIIDLSRAAAERIGMIGAGVVEVRVEVMAVP
jgi:rare lipoprotein A